MAPVEASSPAGRQSHAADGIGDRGSAIAAASSPTREILRMAWAVNLFCAAKKTRRPALGILQNDDLRIDGRVRRLIACFPLTIIAPGPFSPNPLAQSL